MSGRPTLSFDAVGFRYRRAQPAVLDGVTWVPGRVAGLLGPNGAGKSTLFALASGARRPTSGRILVGGAAVGAGRVAWMPQEIRAMPGLRAREQAALAGWMQGLDRADAWEAAGDALAAVGLADRARIRATELSGGQLRRLGMAEVLCGRPSAILLDEPTVGLDPVQRADLLELVGALGERCQVIVATHLVEDLARSFDSVAVLVGGGLRFSGSVDDFLAVGSGGEGPGEFGVRAGEAYRHLVGPPS